MNLSNICFLDIASAYWERELRNTSIEICGHYNNGTKTFRKNVYNLPEYYFWIHYIMATEGDVFISFYTLKERDTGEVSSIFIDVDKADNEKVEDIWQNLIPFIEIFYNNMEIYYSGSKGFHARIYTNKFNINNISKYRDIMYYVSSAWAQHYIDKVTFLSLGRLYRLPLTPHSKTKLYKIPVRPDMKYKEIEIISKEPQEYLSYLEQEFKRIIYPVKYEILLKNPVSLIKNESYL